tara:strand:+ start:5970 stop:6281 length:312 start_codon:yes stop_codon:yes gene_type:complete
MCKELIKIKEFLARDDFDGFSGDDLFIKKFIKQGLGQDIAALSNMAEGISGFLVLRKWYAFQSIWPIFPKPFPARRTCQLQPTPPQLLNLPLAPRPCMVQLAK